LLYCSETWTIKGNRRQKNNSIRDEIGISEIQHDTLGQNTKQTQQITKELKITLILGILLEYKRNWIQQVNRMSRNRLPRVMKHYSPTGRKNHGIPLKILLDA